MDTALQLLPGTSLLTFATLSLAQEALEEGSQRLVPFAAPWLRLNYGFCWHRDALLTVAAREFMANVHLEEQQLQAHEKDLARHYGCLNWQEDLEQ